MGNATNEFLAIDLGAESGRGVIGAFDGERVELREIGRFPTGPAAVSYPDGTVRWDIHGIFREVKTLVNKTESAISGVGVDSWGVDFGLVDKTNTQNTPPNNKQNQTHSEAQK